MKHHHATSLVMACLFLALLALPPVSRPPQAQAQTAERCFAETGYCIAGRIRAFWEQNGGLRVFGLPISPLQTQEIEGQPRQVQWFERNRLELHPENQRPFDVQVGRLGVDLLAQQGRDWWAFPPSAPQEGCRYFPETRHNLCGSFLAAWRAGGLELDGRTGKSELENLALFGMPISDARTEQLADGRTYTVQWFERVRFELHPDNPPPNNVLLGLLGSELQGLGGEAVPASVARYEPAACPFGNRPRVECGYLTVPEDRGNPGGATIRLAVAIVRSNSPNPAPDPLVYLSGGPGSGATYIASGLALSFGGFMGNRDLIVFDQRGTGYSEPRLICPEVAQALAELSGRTLAPGDKVRAETDALLRCKDRLVGEGVNLAAYSSAASAADMEDLRQTLGYAQWNIIGISYGTRLALTAMRDYPAGIRSVILDSVYPPQVNLYTGMPFAINRAFQTLFDNCAADPGCNASYPDLGNVFYALIDRLNQQPITVQVLNPNNGRFIPMVFDGYRFIDLTFRSVYRTSEIPGLPRMIYDTSNGNYAALADLQSRRMRGGGSQGVSHAMYFAVQCNEEILFEPLEAVQAAAAAYPRLQNFFLDTMEFTENVYTLCAAWGISSPDPRENLPVQSDIPTLILAGEYDPITPPTWAPQTAETLSRSYVYEFPNTGHAVIVTGACPVGIARDFINTPTNAPNSACIP